MSLIISTFFSYTIYAKKSSKKTSCTITVRVYDVDRCFDDYAATIPNKNASGYDQAWLDFTQATGLQDKIKNENEEKSSIYEMGWQKAREKQIFYAGKYAFGYNQKDVKCSPSLKGGYGGYSNKLSLNVVGTTHTFTFPDNKNVQLVIASYDANGNSKGGIMGKITYSEHFTATDNGTTSVSNGAGLKKQQQYKSVDWFRKTANEKPYTTGGLTITQNSDSSTLEITNVGKGTSASNTTVNVYISKTAFGIDLGNAEGVSNTTIDSGVLKGTTEQNSGVPNPKKNKSGTASKYNVQTTYKPQQDVFNNWTVVQTYVNKLIDTIELLSNAYFGFAFITCILMLIINIVAVAGAVNNPMYRTKIFLRLGVSVVCMALLGASYLLTRLFILTCMGS